jgi:hypothetical protein
MRIEDDWLLCDDGIVRPTVTVHVHDGHGGRESDRFLIDSGADRTVLSADLLHRLQPAGEAVSVDFGLFGIGGAAAFVIVQSVLELVRDDGRAVTIRGAFAAFTDPESTDRSIFGRDVLDNFDLILSRQRDEVPILAPNHQYQVTRL